MNYVIIENHAKDCRWKIRDGTFQTLSAAMGTGGGNVPMVLGVGIEVGGAATTMDASYFKGTGSRGNKERTAIMQGRVRRLTPIECERLQGLPDNYTAEGINEDGNIVKMSDSARYKMIGNGMAQPVANWVIQRIAEVANEAV